ncbi:MAG: precorrin-2 C(20)-methyltransferase [Firmicutes bacterium]|nr:precorrin-2 C(20)-methyltransferase [Bacillota bacterium]
MEIGKLYGIGVGPGDPELLTLKARRILAELDVLLIPKSKQEKRSLALSIVAASIDKQWEYVEMVMPMTTDRDELKKHWQAAAAQAAEVLTRGQDAGFITLGDPTLFSTFTYLMKYVRELLPDIQVEIIPGISAVNSISAWIQQPLAEGEESLVIVPALGEKENLKRLVDQFDNVVLLKAGNQTAKIMEVLKESNTVSRVYFASRCGFKDGFYTDDLSSLGDRKFDYLTSMLIKKNRGGDEA